MAGSFQVTSPGGVPRTVALPIVRSFRSSLLQGGHGSLTVIPGTGALMLAGFAPQVGKSVSPGTAALLLSGIAPQIGKVARPSTGALSLAGIAPRIGKGAFPATGTLLFTGTAPQAVVGRNITVGTGAMILTGLAPTVQLLTAPVQLGPWFTPQFVDPRWHNPRGLR